MKLTKEQKEILQNEYDIEQEQKHIYRLETNISEEEKNKMRSI